MKYCADVEHNEDLYYSTVKAACSTMVCFQQLYVVKEYSTLGESSELITLQSNLAESILLTDVPAVNHSGRFST